MKRLALAALLLCACDTDPPTWIGPVAPDGHTYARPHIGPNAGQCGMCYGDDTDTCRWWAPREDRVCYSADAPEDPQ